MTREEKHISTWLNDSLQSIHAGSDLFNKVQSRMENSKRPYRNWYPLLKKVIPVSLALLLIISFVFPVFGSDGNLMDLYYNYRFQKNIASLRNSTNDEMKNLDKNVNISRLALNTILEEQYQIDPSVVQFLRSHNMDAVEMVLTLYVARQANLEPTEIVGLRNQNYPWGRIIRRFKIRPIQAFQQMRTIRQNIQEKIIVPDQKKLLIRGRVDTFLPDRQIIILENAPFQIYLSQNTALTSPLRQGDYVQITAYYSLITQLVTADTIQSYNPQEVGIMTVSGEILDRNEDQITLRLLDQTVLHLTLAPRILNSPLNPLIRSSLYVKVDVIRGLKNNLVVYNIKKLVPPASVWKNTLP